MSRPVVIGSVNRKEVNKLLTELRKVSYFSLVRRVDNAISYYDSTMTQHKIVVSNEETRLLIV